MSAAAIFVAEAVQLGLIGPKCGEYLLQAELEGFVFLFAGPGSQNHAVSGLGGRHDCPDVLGILGLCLLQGEVVDFAEQVDDGHAALAQARFANGPSDGNGCTSARRWGYFVVMLMHHYRNIVHILHR